MSDYAETADTVGQMRREYEQLAVEMQAAIEQLQWVNDELEKTVAQLERENDTLRVECRALQAENRRLRVPSGEGAVLDAREIPIVG